MNIDAGDIVWAEFGSGAGTEQSGRRPAIVLSSADYHSISPRAVVCPITTTERQWPFDVGLPRHLRARGFVLVDQVRSVDRASRIFRIIERAPADVLERVRFALASLMGMAA